MEAWKHCDEMMGRSTSGAGTFGDANWTLSDSGNIYGNAHSTSTISSGAEVVIKLRHAARVNEALVLPSGATWPMLDDRGSGQKTSRCCSTNG